MSKKPKEAKIPKAPKSRGGNGGGKDSVTGVYFQIIPDNTSKPVRIDSDKQYGLGSDLIQKFLSVGYQVEKPLPRLIRNMNSVMIILCKL